MMNEKTVDIVVVVSFAVITMLAPVLAIVGDVLARRAMKREIREYAAMRMRHHFDRYGKPTWEVK